MKNDRGSASAMMVAGVAFLFVFALALADLSIFLLGRARARTAADAAALAAVAEQIPGAQGSAQVEAARFARLNGARMVECSCRPGGDATVEVAVSLRFLLLGSLAPSEVHARARAEMDLSKAGNALKPPG